MERVNPEEVRRRRPVNDDTVRAVVVSFARTHGLSERETDVIVAAVVHCLSNKEIGRALGISYGTVKQYWSGICSKMECRDAITVLHHLLAYACHVVSPASAPPFRRPK
jgi:DNA-binding NarL/FixJ family response regulator